MRANQLSLRALVCVGFFALAVGPLFSQQNALVGPPLPAKFASNVLAIRVVPCDEPVAEIISIPTFQEFMLHGCFDWVPVEVRFPADRFRSSFARSAQA